MRTRRRHGRGFTLIELMVGIAIMGLLASLAAPGLTEWIRNTRLRSSAEALRSGFQQARVDAIRLNTGTRLQFVSSLDSSCTLSATGAFWVVNMGLAQTPASACGSAPSTTVAPFILGSSTASVRPGITLTSTQSTVGFDSLGRKATTTNPSTPTAGKVVVALSSDGGTCLAAGGNVRCLNVVVFASGEARICDPTRTDATDPMAC